MTRRSREHAPPQPIGITAHDSTSARPASPAARWVIGPPAVAGDLPPRACSNHHGEAPVVAYASFRCTASDRLARGAGRHDGWPRPVRRSTGGCQASSPARSRRSSRLGLRACTARSSASRCWKSVCVAVAFAEVAQVDEELNARVVAAGILRVDEFVDPLPRGGLIDGEGVEVPLPGGRCGSFPGGSGPAQAARRPGVLVRRGDPRRRRAL